MKKLLCVFAMAFAAIPFVGCEDYDEKANRLTFENASHFSVQVISLTTEWNGFNLAPGERVRMNDIRDVDYRYEPEGSVQEGSASSDRYIVFVDAPPSDDEEDAATDEATTDEAAAQ
ncbi:MAG TPA: hypothetical protein P5567_05620 [Kiritimatiellia bacterium]|nr:hypothetical protein [Kiritimatiellia bacterium]HRZ11917.1 hypothetical protein [Kiritimatiellia bacterium]HSA17277.1 hypothetical protein [Kiritimatiellia bacterium]